MFVTAVTHTVYQAVKLLESQKLSDKALVSQSEIQSSPLGDTSV